MTQDKVTVTQGDMEVTQEDEAFARKTADDFLADMDTPLIGARHTSIMAAVKNGIHHGRTTALAAKEAELAAALAKVEKLREAGDVLHRRLMGFVCALAEMTDCGPDVDAMKEWKRATLAETQPERTQP